MCVWGGGPRQDEQTISYLISGGLKLPTLGTSPIIKVMDMNIRKYFYSLFRIPQNFFANLFHVLCAFLIINITTGTESHNNVIKEDFSFRLG